MKDILEKVVSEISNGQHSHALLVSSITIGVLFLIMSVMSGREVKPLKPSRSKQPQPKWVILQAMNYVVLAVFVSSVTFAISSQKYLHVTDNVESMNSELLPFAIVWSLCLAYFFGFFGISFLDTDALHESTSSDDLVATVEEVVADQNNITQRPLKVLQSINKASPRADGPICSDIQINTEPVTTNKPIKSNTVEGAELDFTAMEDDDVLQSVLDGSLKDYQLEKKLGDYERAVRVRRGLYEHLLGKKIESIPYSNYDYNKVFGANCEIVVGYVPIPVGIVGPLVMNEEPIYVPMATTEGCLVASTNRGCKAISMSGGCNALLLKDAITRAPCIKMPSAVRAAAMKKWIDTPENYKLLETAFNSTTSFGRLESCTATISGRNVYLRFCCMAGDAMGMNMVSKGCLKAIDVLEQDFPDLDLVAISGNMCTDKKPAAINWILGRGKSIVVEAVIPEEIVKNVLKTSVHDMIETNKQKNLIGSAMAGSVGGFNAHAANIVTAVYLATGQDPAQNVESSNCITNMELDDDGVSLHVSVTMPSIEVGTVGGGTHLPAQAGCLDICGVRGAAKAPKLPGDNARQLAKIVGSSVLAGELSLMAALAANHLVKAHMDHNRKPTAAGGAPSTISPSGDMRRVTTMPELSSNTAPRL